MDALLLPDERRLVTEAAKKYLTEKECVDPEVYFPAQDPRWAWYTEEGLKMLNTMREALLEGIRTAIGKTLNWDRVHACIQKACEHASDFLNRLLTEIERHTSIDPHLPENQAIINQIYIFQAAPDIKQWIQLLDSYERKTTNELIRIATSLHWKARTEVQRMGQQ